MILLSLTTYKADDGTDIVNLCGPLSIHAGTMVRAYYCITVIKQRLYDGAEVGHTLAAIAKPCATIDMDNDRIALCLFLRQIDVTSMIGFIIACIVHVLPLLRGLQFYLRSLETTKASSGLCHSANSSQTHYDC